MLRSPWGGNSGPLDTSRGIVTPALCAVSSFPTHKSILLVCCLRLIPSRTHGPNFSSYHILACCTPVPTVHAGCNGSHLAVGALGVMNGVEHRDRRANFLTRALSVEHPAVLPTVLLLGAAVRRYTRQQAELLVVQMEAEKSEGGGEGKGEGGGEGKGEGEGEGEGRGEA